MVITCYVTVSQQVRFVFIKLELPYIIKAMPSLDIFSNFENF